MKKIVSIFILIGIVATGYAQTTTEVITVQGTEYNIVVSDDYNDLRNNYIRVMESYIGEILDYEKLDDAFTTYKDSSEITIDAKDKLIAGKTALIDIKDKRIKELEDTKEIFSIIPSVYYSRGTDFNGFGGGVGIVLFDSLFIQAQGGYPLEMRFSAGWKF